MAGSQFETLEDVVVGETDRSTKYDCIDPGTGYRGCKISGLLKMLKRGNFLALGVWQSIFFLRRSNFFCKLFLS